VTPCTFCREPTHTGTEHSCCAKHWPRDGRCLACDASRTAAARWVRESKVCVSCNVQLSRRNFKGDKCVRCAA
jgi:hypothetical protein